MTTIRDATEADLPRILEIANEAIANTTAVWSLAPATPETRKAWLLDRRGRGFPVLVADRDGAVLGFASYGDFRPWDGYLHTVEHSLYVHPEAQGRGVGRALLAALVERAGAQGRRHRGRQRRVHRAAPPGRLRGGWPAARGRPQVRPLARPAVHAETVARTGWLERDRARRTRQSA
jgi:phosphinothricin acetyltransferase